MRIGELEDENWGLGSTTLVRAVSGELEDENWRLCSNECPKRVPLQELPARVTHKSVGQRECPTRVS